MTDTSKAVERSASGWKVSGCGRPTRVKLRFRARTQE